MDSSRKVATIKISYQLLTEWLKEHTNIPKDAVVYNALADHEEFKQGIIRLAVQSEEFEEVIEGGKIPDVTSEYQGNDNTKKVEELLDE